MSMIYPTSLTSLNFFFVFSQPPSLNEGGLAFRGLEYFLFFSFVSFLIFPDEELLSGDCIVFFFLSIFFLWLKRHIFTESAVVVRSRVVLHWSVVFLPGWFLVVYHSCGQSLKDSAKKLKEQKIEAHFILE